MENTIKEHFETEDQMQAAFIMWFDNTFPKYRWDLFAVPNGGDRDKRTANLLKATGVRAGVTDIIWMLPYSVEFIELKLPTGKQSPEQKRFEQRCTTLHLNYNLFFSLWSLKDFVMSKINECYGDV